MNWVSHLPASLQTILLLVAFGMIFMSQPFPMDFLWVGLCLVGAVYFISR